MLFDGYCQTVTISRAAGPDLVIAAPETCRFMIQDNRKWGQGFFEVRLTFLMSARGQAVGVDDSYEAELCIGLDNRLMFVEGR